MELGISLLALGAIDAPTFLHLYVHLLLLSSSLS